MKKQICAKCGEYMRYIGNISGMVYLSNPVQYDATYVCESCKEKRTIREWDKSKPDYFYLKDYPEQSNF